jgi:hypothetical protein
MFLGNAAIIFSGALGDVVCVSGALNQYYKQNKERLYLITENPSLFIGQEYCKEVIAMNFFGQDGSENKNDLYKKFKKIYSLYWQTEKHLKGYCSISENYCEQLNVKKIKYPFFKIDPVELNNFNIVNKPYILVSLKNNRCQTEFIDKNSKYFTNKTNLEIILNLKKDFKNHEIIDLADIRTNNLKDLVLAVAKCDTFLSVDTSLQHLAANEFLQKKGVVLWNNSGNIDIFGYKNNINLVSNFFHPYNNYDIIYKNLKLILEND